MANNLIQIKRTSVSGRAANTTTLTNPGELALNMTDGIMYSTNGSTVFEVGANLTSIAVGNSTSRFVANTTRVAIGTSQGLLANGSIGTNGQVLTSNGTTVYWASGSSGVNAQQAVYTYTLAANATVIQGADDSAQTLSYTAGLENVFINGSRQIAGVDYNTTNSTAITLLDPALTGEVVQVVTWQGAVNSVNAASQYTWTNTHTFSNTVTFTGAISANGSLGTAGQVLHSNGTALYWGPDDNAGGTVTSIATANGLSGGTITTSGTLGVTTGSTLTVNTTGIHVNSALSITSLALTGALSGVTTLAAGNTTITGFVNATSTVNASGLAVGTSFIANTTGAYHTGTVNAASYTIGTSFTANSTLVNAAALNVVNQVNTATLYATTSANIASAVQANSTGIFTTGTANAAIVSVGTAFVANTTRVVIGTATGLQANGGIGTAGQVLTSNATTVYWSTPTTGTVTSIATANGLSGGTITSSGTLGVTTGPTLTVNTTGIHVNSTLSLTDLTVSGNLTVSGTRTYVNTTTLDVGDNIITLNADLGAVAPTENAGIEIMRGTSANVQFIWDETNDRWTTNGQPLAISSLVAAGAASGITTLAAGNTTITGFANVAFGSGGGLSGPGSGSWAGKIVTNQDTTAYNGLSVQNRWAAATSVIFEAAMGWNGTAAGYYPVFTVDGLGQVTINSNAPQAFVMGTYANGNVGFGNNAPAHKVSIAGTLAAGNTTITGFVNATASVNSAILAVGTSFIANTTGAYHTGTINAASYTVGTTFTANATLVNAAALNVVNQVNTATLYATTSANIASAVQANATGVFTTGTVNAAIVSVGTSFVANTTRVVIGSAVGLQANGSVGTDGQILTSNGTTAYWATSTAATTGKAIAMAIVFGG